MGFGFVWRFSFLPCMGFWSMSIVSDIQRILQLCFLQCLIVFSYSNCQDTWISLSSYRYGYTCTHYYFVIIIIKLASHHAMELLVLGMVPDSNLHIFVKAFSFRKLVNFKHIALATLQHRVKTCINRIILKNSTSTDHELYTEIVHHNAVNARMKCGPRTL